MQNIMQSSSYKDDISGVILAGGQSSRMGGQDKGLCKIHDKPLITYVLQTLRPQVSTLYISANRHLKEYAEIGQCPLLTDTNIGTFLGPMAGILSGLQAASSAYVAYAPCDAPKIPLNYISRLYAALQAEHADISVAHDGVHLQPMFALLSRRLVISAQDFLNSGQRGVHHFYQQHHMVSVDFSDVPQMFLNLNTPEQVHQFVNSNSAA
jgi:molybdenum cofactor guanylyltransferase